ncbi:MAG: hypothetical protein JNL96_13655 [Planctomycetaceae bacterium]|nr:hypothetical protein [Planctomycetaceae bacterium]
MPQSWGVIPLLFALVVASSLLGRSRVAAQTAPAAQPPEAQPAAPQEFAPPEAGLRISVPGKPRDLGGWTGMPGAKVYARMYHWLDEPRKQAVTVTAVRLPQAPAADALDNVFRHALAGVLGALQGEIVDDAKAAVDDFPARRWLIKVGDRFYHVRAVVADDRFYQVSLETAERSLDAEQAKLLDSFHVVAGAKLVDPPRPIDWRYVTAEGEKFAVQFPDEPKEWTDKAWTKVFGETPAQYLSWTSADGGVMYVAGARKLPRAAAASEAEQAIEELRERFRDHEGVALADDKAITVGGAPGRAFSAVKGDRAHHVRIVVAGDRLYVLTATAAAKPTAEDLKFLDSLKISSR